MTQGTDSTTPAALFDAKGSLDRQYFTDGAFEVLEACVGWLGTIERSMMLPIDLIIVLLRRGDPTLQRSISRVARGKDDATGLVEQLETLARRVDRRGDEVAKLHVEQFSLGLIGILEDAMAWAREAGRTSISEADLVRVVRWRAELQDSASVRWALKQLAQPGDERLFDLDGALRPAAFSTSLWGTFQQAMRLASTAGMPFLGTPHLMAALSGIEGGILQRAAHRAGIEPSRLRVEFARIVGTREPEQSPFPLGRRTLTPRLVRMIVGASEKLERSGDTIGEAELLEAFLHDGGSSLELVNSLGLVVHLRSELGEPRIHAVEREDGNLPAFANEEHLAGSPVLDQLGRDLTAEARAGRLPPVLGREDELQRMINVLLRPEQRNPLLTGEAGVGKTALAVALAQRIVEGTVPARLRGMRVVEINGAGLVGGTSYRGELEARIKSILTEAERDVILFMDEAHAVFAPRLGSGQPAEVPNHFKSALASGKIAVIAATTEAEFHRWIEQDPALQRRFERIVIPEMTRDLTASILRELAPDYEKAYEVPVTPEAVEAAIDLSIRYMPELSLPDKAKKLLMDSVIAVSSDLARQRNDRTGKGEVDVGSEGTPNKRTVVRQDVAVEVSRKTGIPLDRILRSSSPEWWNGLQERLSGHAFGRTPLVETVTRALMQARLRDPSARGVHCALAFIGPVGSGKAQLVRGLASELYGDERSLLHLDMSDYQEAHSISRLIGTAPGYVGYQDEDALVTPLRRRPASVVLLQSFQLAHHRVQDRFFRLFAEGELTDTRGLRADASHAIFVLTLDVEGAQTGGIGFGADRSSSALARLSRQDEPLLERLRKARLTLVDFAASSEVAAFAEQWIDEQLAALEESLQTEFGTSLCLPVEEREGLRARARETTDLKALEELFRTEVIEPLTQRLLDPGHGTATAPETSPGRRSDQQPPRRSTVQLGTPTPPPEGGPDKPDTRPRVTRKI